MHSQPPKSPTPLSRGARNRPLAIPPYHGGFRGTLETSLGSELLVNVYLFLAFTIVRSYALQPRFYRDSKQFVVARLLLSPLLVREDPVTGAGELEGYGR